MTPGLAVAVYGLLLVPGAVLVWRRPALALYAWIVGLAAHNAVMAALYGAGVRGGALTVIQAWKEILLGVALARVAVEVLRTGRLAFRIHPADVLALAFAALVCVYAVLPQDWLGGTADRSAIGLALKHDLVPVGAYFLGRSVVLRGEELVRLVWTVVGTAAAVAVLGLVDDFFVPISWWRDSAVVDYFHKHLGYDYHGTGGLPENFVFNNGGDAEGFYRRLVSTFLGPLASAYTFVVALLLGAAFLRRLRILIPLSAVIGAGLLFTFSRSSLLALAAGFVVLAFVTRRWWPVAAAVATLAVSVAWVHVFPHVAPQGKWTQQDLVEQRNNAKNQPGASGSAGSIDEPSIHSHWISLREGVRTVVHHPQGFGLGNAGQTASRTGTPIKAGESNYTEIGAETGLLGTLLWIVWGLAIFVALLVPARRTRWWAAAGIAAAFGASLALAVQTDVIGDPWMAYCLWALAGIVLTSVPLPADGDRSASGHRPRSPEGERHRPRARVLP
ncbi:MAG: O-antigen ligase family protein [Actinomycetota bacterium]|nr:O-antigen ligase family protein [Actinomycetota bacterium]